MAGFIGAGTLAGNATVTPQAISSHASTAIGDILIAQIINKSSTANVVSPPDGTWTKLVEGTNLAGTVAHRHQYTLFWKIATVAGAQSYTFTKATDDNVLFAGVISTWRTLGGGLDPTAVGTTVTTAAADNVSFPAFDPAGVAHVIYFAFYGLNTTTFGSMAGTNPTCTTRYDLESATGTACTLAATSGDSDPSNITSRTWASASTTDAGNTGVVLALSDAAPPVGPALPLARRVVAQAGGVSGPIVISASGSNDVRFASSWTRLNIRQGLLYRSLTISAPIVAAPSADIITVTSASVIFTGKPVLVLDTEPVTKADVLFTGQTVTVGDATQPGSGDVQFASTRTRLNVRQGLLYRSLTAPPRVGGTTDTTAVTQATVVYAGKTVTVLDTEVTPVLKATVVFTGKTVVGVELGAITKGQISLIGKPVLETETIPITKATVTVAGKTVTLREAEVTPVAKATVTVFGKPITEYGLIPVNKATVTFACQTVTIIDPGVDRITVDPASVTLTGKTVDPSTEITKAAITFAGKTVTVRDFEVTPVAKATVTFTGKTVTLRDSEVTAVAKATVLFAGQTVTIPADTPVSAKLVISYTPGGNRQDLTGNLGMVFALSVDATFDQIGLRCGLDNTGIHAVDLYDYATGTLLRTGNVNLTGATEGQFYYTSIAPITLVAGTYYALGAQTTASDGQWWASNGPTTLHDAAYVAAAYRSAGVWTPTALVDQQYIGVDLGYAVTGVTEVIPIGPGAIRFTGQEVTLTGQGEVQPPIGGGGGVFVPPWIDYGRKKRRRYRALEEIEKRIDARIEKLKAETKQTQEKVAEVISQPGQIDVLSQQFAELLRQQALITGMLLEAQRRAEVVRQERVELARLAQIAAFEADEEEAITMLLLT